MTGSKSEAIEWGQDEVKRPKTNGGAVGIVCDNGLLRMTSRQTGPFVT